MASRFTGLQILMRGLARKYAPLCPEIAIKAIAEFFHVRRLGGESVDNFITRFDLLKSRAEGQGMVINPLTVTWMFLEALGIPTDPSPTSNSVQCSSTFAGLVI